MHLRDQTGAVRGALGSGALPLFNCSPLNYTPPLNPPPDVMGLQLPTCRRLAAPARHAGDRSTLTPPPGDRRRTAPPALPADAQPQQPKANSRTTERRTAARATRRAERESTAAILCPGLAGAERWRAGPLPTVSSLGAMAASVLVRGALRGGKVVGAAAGRWSAARRGRAVRRGAGLCRAGPPWAPMAERAMGYGVGTGHAMPYHTWRHAL